MKEPFTTARMRGLGNCKKVPLLSFPLYNSSFLGPSSSGLEYRERIEYFDDEMSAINPYQAADNDSMEPEQESNCGSGH